MDDHPPTNPASEDPRPPTGGGDDEGRSPAEPQAGVEQAPKLSPTPELYTPHPWLNPLSRAATGAVWLMVWVYRLTLGPFIGGHCRYVPTCSQYMLDATRKYGPVRGVIKGIGRILRCHPWGGQGHDPA